MDLFWKRGQDGNHFRRADRLSEESQGIRSNAMKIKTNVKAGGGDYYLWIKG